MSNIKSLKKSTTNLDDDSYNQTLTELVSRLKNAIFSKFISNYLIDKVDEMWMLYEKRIDKFLKDQHLQIDSDQKCPETAVKLKQFAECQQENIDDCQQNIELLCSTHKRLRSDDKYSVSVQSMQYQPIPSRSTIRVPKTPRCLDRLEHGGSNMTNKIYEAELNDLKQSDIVLNEIHGLSKSSNHDKFNQYIFKYGEVLPLDPSTKTRTIRIAYLCNN